MSYDTERIEKNGFAVNGGGASFGTAEKGENTQVVGDKTAAQSEPKAAQKEWETGPDPDEPISRYESRDLPVVNRVPYITTKLWKPVVPVRPGTPSVPSTSGASAVSVPNVKDVMSEMRETLAQWQKNAAAQSDGKINAAVSEAVTALERALADSQSQFKEQTENIAWEERQAMDNAALYAELRGDRGGVGQSQYNAIQNTAAQKRLAVRQAQTKLATDTSRQIADLRAKGEFEKADAALSLGQQYLEKLVALEQWAAEFGLDAQEFNLQLRKWEQEYADTFQKSGDSQRRMAGNSIGYVQWAEGLDGAQRKFVTDMGSALMDGGIVPSSGQVYAMGMTEREAASYMFYQQLREAGA